MIPIFVGLLGGGLLAGAAIVVVLVSPRSVEPLAALAGAAGAGWSTYCISLVHDHYGTTQSLTAGVVLGMGAVTGGYALASALLYRFAGPDAPLKIPAELPDVDMGPAVLVCACYEPSSYDPRYTASALAILDDEEEVELGIGVTPLLYTTAKARYRAAGGKSPSKRQMELIAEALEEQLGPEFSGRVTIAACAGKERLAARVLEAADAGSRRIVVAELAVGEALPLANAKREVDAARLYDLGVEVMYTAPLWGSDRIAALIAERVMRAVADLDTTGVILVAHGQNPDRSRRNPEYDENEAAFVSRVRMLVAERGVTESNIRTAWSGWHDPDVTSTVRHLAALGCRRVLVVPATYPLETISTTIDLVTAARQARVDDSVSVVALPAWRDEPQVVEELAERVVAVLGGTR